MVLDSNSLIEIESIRQLKARYVRYGDTKKWEEFAEIFTEDVQTIYEVCPRLHKSDPYYFECQGRDNLIAAMAPLMKDATTVHHLFSSEIELRGMDEATGLWSMHDFVKLPTCIFNGYGHYHETYVKIGGEWKISYSKTTRTYTTEEWF